jgi:hypothetical protein
LIEVHKRFKDGVPLLDPIQDMKITEPVFAALVKVADILSRLLLFTASGVHFLR